MIVKKVSKLILMSTLVCLPAMPVYADDEDDVLAVIHQWAALEQDLEAQAELVRDDRVQIGGGVRQSNQAQNLAVQLMNYEAMVDSMGGEPDMMVRIESPLIRIYDNTAVTSFVRLFNISPPGERASPVSAAWFSMVLIKEGGEWKIAHHHVSNHGT
ncbi:MAG: nuclear transport factor 2 family protein [Gammaproteobacteria bacterium]|nr:nuclear transport factor 2 family protein [Gammaproteobacteria bacterium]